METTKKVRKIKPYGAEWKKRAYILANNFHTINTCRDCNSPVMKGYCCTFCKSSNP